MIAARHQADNRRRRPVSERAATIWSCDWEIPDPLSPSDVSTAPDPTVMAIQ